MALVNPAFQLRPIQPPQSPVDRFGKIAEIQSMLEGSALRRQELELRQQALQGTAAEQQRKARAVQRVQQIMADSQGDYEKALSRMAEDPELLTLVPESVKFLQDTLERRKPATPKTSVIETVKNGKAGRTVIDEAKSIGSFFESPQKEATPAAEPNSVREYQFYAEQETKAGRTPKRFEDWVAKPASSSSPTSQIQEYNFYVDQETKAGRNPLSFDAWQTQDANRKRVVPPSVVIQTVNDKGEDVTKIVPKIPGSEFASGRTADMKNKDANRNTTARAIDAAQELSRKIVRRIGPAQRAEAIKRGAEAVFGTDPEFRTYQDARKSIAGALAVATQGSRPSDADILQIWLPLVPDAYRDTSESAEMKWRMIRQNAGLPEFGSGGNPALKDVSTDELLKRLMK
jgi:hypothetical protein